MAKKSKEALPTQQFVDVKGVKDGVLILENGGLRQILMVSGLNFDLKSDDEQKAITFAYQGFLNALDFSLQIFIHSRKINIDAYTEHLNKLEAVETNPLLKAQIGEYREFIKSFVSENAIMNKSFFVVVPYDPVRIPGKKGGFLRRKVSKKADEAEEKKIDHGISQLHQRTDQVVTGLNQIGLRVVPLKDDEVVELFYNLYNPDAIEKKGLELDHANPAGALNKKI